MLLNAVCLVLLQVTTVTAQPSPCVGPPPPFPVSATRPAPVFKNARALQKIAHAATTGKLGCGQGVVTLCTRSGVVSQETTFDVLHVFGPAVAVSDLIGLLLSRHEANRTGRGPMSGERTDLLIITLQAIGLSSAPEALEALLTTLEDPDVEVSRGTARALVSLGEAVPSVRSSIRGAYLTQRRAFVDQGCLQLLLPSWLTAGT